MKGKPRLSVALKDLRVPEDVLQLNGRNIPFVSNVKYLGVIFDRRMTWRLHIERTAAKALTTYVRTYSLFKRERLNINIKLTLYKALIRSICLSHL
jgi:ABC-type transporter MlaC component